MTIPWRALVVLAYCTLALTAPVTLVLLEQHEDRWWVKPITLLYILALVPFFLVSALVVWVRQIRA